MQKKLTKIVNKKLGFLDEHTVEVIKKSSSATIVKILGMIAGLLVSVALGRILGAGGLGIINLANKLIFVIAIITLLGTPQLLVKKIAIAYRRKNWQQVSDYLFSAFRLNGIVTILISGILIICTPWIANHFFHEPDLKIPLMIALGAMIFYVVSRIYSSALTGFHKIWQSNLVNQGLNIAITGAVLLGLWLAGIKITIINAAIAYAVGRIGTTLTVGVYWKKTYKPKIKKKVYVHGLTKLAFPFLLLSAAGVIFTSINQVMLGWLGDAKEVGLYSVATKIAMLTIFFLQITNSALSPKLAALYEDNKIKEMNRMVQRVTTGLLIVAAIPLIIFSIFGESILSIWGEEFSEAYWILIIMSIGQFFNIGTGASGTVLAMCGHEKLHAWILFACILLNMIICYFLIPLYGGIGAAIAIATVLFLGNIAKVIFVKSKVGILTLPTIKF